MGCDYKEDVIIPALGTEHVHDYNQWQSNWDGHKKMCACGETTGNIIAHENELVVIEEATDFKNGLGYDKCTVCGYMGNPYIIPATNHTHNFPDTWTYDNGYHWHECSCGEIDEESYDYHKMGAWNITKFPTSTSAGSKERSCTICEFKEIIPIPALAEEVVVTFDSQGGSSIGDKTIDNGKKVDKPTDPTRIGYDFQAWYTSLGYEEEWKFGSSVYENMTLYAKWEISITGPPAIISDSLPQGIVGKEYNVSLEASGATPISWSIKSGSLPQGLALSDDGIISGTPNQSGTFTFEIKADNGKTPDAIKEFSLTIAPVFDVIINGSYASTSGAGKYEKGETVTIYAGSRSNYSFNGWTSSDGVSFANANSATTSFTMPDRSVIVRANWIYNGSVGSSTSKYYDIKVVAEEGGSISPSEKSYLIGGQDKTFTITPDKGYKILDVLVDEVSVGALDSYTFKNVFKSHTIRAIFAKEGEDIVENPFTDVNDKDWFYDNVKYVFEKGLMNGVSATSFDPNGNTTRGMIVTILHRLEGEPSAGASPYTDVEEGLYYSQAVAWATENKIVKGYGNNLFGPNDPITREQMALILMNYADFKAYDISAKGDLSKYEDADAVSEWARDAMAWANGEELINGDGSKLMPTGNATRAQVAAILQRFIEKF